MKNLLNFGTATSKNDQKKINGGKKKPSFCSSIYICPGGGTGADGEVCVLDGGIWGTMQGGLCCS